MNLTFYSAAATAGDGVKVGARGGYGVDKKADFTLFTASY
jgi:hypothetical protein